VTEKKIELEKKDLQRLSQLSKDQEQKHDATTWSEDLLYQEELNLQIRINKIAGKMPNKSHENLDPDEEMQKSWQTLQKTISNQNVVHTWGTIETKFLLPIRQLTKKRLASPKWWSMAAVAVIAGFVILPRAKNLSRFNEEDLLVSKGTSKFSAIQCDLDVMNPDGQSLSISQDGLNYIAPAGSKFQISMNCNTSGYLHIEAFNTETRSLRNLAIKSDQATRFSGQKASFQINADKAWTIQIMLTSDPIDENLAITANAQRGDLWGSTPILWIDTLQVRQSQQ
jgi:hypothetical protein